MTSFAMGLGLALLVSVLINAAIPSETRSGIADRLYTVPTFYFVVAFLSGLAGAFAFFWPRIIEALAGIAISVALIPPVVMLGIGISELSRKLVQGSAKILVLNVIGMVMGAYAASAGLHLVCSGLATWRMFFEPGGTAVTIRTNSAKNKRELQSMSGTGLTG